MILVAPTAFKGTISATAAANAIAKGVRRVGKERVVVLPLSDGGPGLIEALQQQRSGRLQYVNVSDPLGRNTRARLLHQDSTIIVESADACGLHLVDVDRRNPLLTTSYGVGQLVAAAAREQPERIILGLGGSATVDGGVGMATALGWRFLDDTGAELPAGGGALHRIARIDGSRAQHTPPVVALADVVNSLTGAAGAARVFGPQKGATDEQVEVLERGLTLLAALIENERGVRAAELPGAGAAGGLGAGARWFLHADLVAGSEWLLARVGFDSLLAGAELLITGEGAYDGQSAMGKITGVVIERARLRGVPVLLVSGKVVGALPPHVHAATGKGALLDAQRITQLVSETLPALLP